MEMNSYSYRIAIHLFGCILFKGIVILQRGIGIPLKNEKNTYSFPVGINKNSSFAQKPQPSQHPSLLSLSLFFLTQYLSPSLQLYSHSPLSVSQPSLICCGFFFFFLVM
jgi:hypothetical protein